MVVGFRGAIASKLYKLYERVRYSIQDTKNIQKLNLKLKKLSCLLVL